MGVNAFEMYAGDTRQFDIPVAGPEGFSLTGSTVRWQLSRCADSAPLVSKDLGSGVQIVGPRTIRVTVYPADTDGREPGYYYHECEIVLANGFVRTLFGDSFKIMGTLIR